MTFPWLCSLSFSLLEFETRTTSISSRFNFNLSVIGLQIYLQLTSRIYLECSFQFTLSTSTQYLPHIYDLFFQVKGLFVLMYVRIVWLFNHYSTYIFVWGFSFFKVRVTVSTSMPFICILCSGRPHGPTSV